METSCNVCPFFVNDLSSLPTVSPHSLSLQKIVRSDIPWQFILLGNYMIDLEWLLQLEHVGPALRSVQDHILCLSGEASNHRISAAAKASGILSKLRIVSPPLPLPYGTHHAKTFLGVNRRGMRLMICTANYLCDDWTRKNQGIYCQDFPFRHNFDSRSESWSNVQADGGGPKEEGAFERDLVTYFVRSGWSNAATILNRFDFSAAQGLHIISSVPGYHIHKRSSDDDPLFGLWKLKDIVSKHVPLLITTEQLHISTLETPRNVDRRAYHPSYCPPTAVATVTWQYSSQGSLNDKFLSDFRHAMTMTKAHDRGTRSILTLGQQPTALIDVKVIFPTEQEIRNSVEGWRSGLSIPVPMKNFHPYINSRLFRWGQHHREKVEKVVVVEQDENSGRRKIGDRHRAMPHIKTYTRFQSITNVANGQEKDILDYFILTSANLSRAAWGDVQKDGQQLQIRSFELGVLFSPMFSSTKRREVSVKGSPLSSNMNNKAVENNKNGWTSSSTSQLPQTSPNELLVVFSVTDPTPYPTSAQRVQCNDNNLFAHQLGEEEGGPLLWLPYSPRYCIPYESTRQLRRDEEVSRERAKNSNKTEIDPMAHNPMAHNLDLSPADVPWAIDMPHHGKDLLGQVAADCFGSYSHYGEKSWNAPTLRFPSSSDKTLVEESVHCGTIVNRKEVIDVDEIINCEEKEPSKKKNRLEK